jgi:metallo-beta-lactamase class B
METKETLPSSAVPSRLAAALAGLLLFGALAAPACAQADAASRSRNQPVEPFRILANLYYVGASDITSFLITTPQGHILLDGGFAETAPLIRRGIEKLGFRLQDVKILLNSHAHFDHAGGLAELQRLSGAQLMASAGDAPLLARGGKGDPLFGDQLTFPPVEVSRLVHDGESVSLGGVSLVAHVTAGHTPGCTTWSLRLDDGGRSRDVVFVCSTTVLPGMRLAERPTYPTIAADYARTFHTLRALPCDVFLASHGSFFDLEPKARRLAAGERPNPFIDPAGYRAYLDRMEKTFRDELARQTHPGPAP